METWITRNPFGYPMAMMQLVARPVLVTTWMHEVQQCPCASWEGLSP